MGEWHKYQPPDPNYPCTNCQMGSCGITSEMRDGELWTKTDDCHETCEMLKEYDFKHLRRAMGGGIISDSQNYGSVTIR